MIADFTAWVYCEHRDWVKREDGNRHEVQCAERTEAMLRHFSNRGKDHLRVVSFVRFVSTGWAASVDNEQTCHVYCAKHASGINYAGNIFLVQG